MFNLQESSINPAQQESRLLRSELSSFDIFPGDGGKYDVVVGDETIEGISLQECSQLIKSAVQELKSDLWEEWQDLGQVADLILQSHDGNRGTLDNIYFLSSVKRAFHLSKRFTQLNSLSETIYKLFNVDIVEVNPDLIAEFNRQFLKIHLLHKLIMIEMYRLKIIVKYSRISKQAQISGPWANLDLPMSERVWEWSEDEEDMGLKDKSKKEQARYNPEYNQEGFYFVWQDFSRDPYRFEDMGTDSPYKSRSLLAIP